MQLANIIRSQKVFKPRWLFHEYFISERTLQERVIYIELANRPTISHSKSHQLAIKIQCYKVKVVKTIFSMVDKRAFPEDAGHDDLDALIHRPKPRLSFQNAVIKGVIADHLTSAIEPIIRKVVSEELDKRFIHSLHSSSRTPLDHPQSSPKRDLQLLFIGKIKEPSYTNSKIEAEGKRPLRIVLVDAITRKPVNCGSLSSIKVELVPLEGTFNSDDKEYWTVEEFNQGIAHEREGRKPLLTGDRIIKLKNGEGDIRNISFTDNSSCSRSGKFRIGAKVPDGVYGRKEVMEAVSEAFTVRDHRGESYQKHYPPRANDEVWRLEEISKDGKRHKRLADHNIHTVENFLQSYAIDPISLRHIIGNGASLSDKTWDKIIEHATTYIENDAKLYQYTEIGIQLFLNSIYRVVGATFDGENYLSPEKFSLYQKDMVERLKQQAYQHPNNLVLLDDTAAVFISNLLMNQQPEPSINPGIDGLSTHPSTTYALQGEVINQFIGSSTGQISNPVQEFNLTHKNSFRFPDDFENCIGNDWFPSSLQGIIFPCEHPTPDVNPQAYMAAWSTNDAPWSHGEGMLYSNNAAEGGISSTVPGINIHFATVRPSIGWFKIWAAVKWGISFRKNIAARRVLAPLPSSLQA